MKRLVRTYPGVVRGSRGIGFMQGLELQPREQIPAFLKDERASSLQVVQRLHQAGVLTIPSGGQVIRLLPALNIGRAQLEEGVALLEGVLKAIG